MHAFDIVHLPFAYSKCPKYNAKEFYEKYPLADSFSPGYGYYINFFKNGDTVFMPVFRIPEDEKCAEVLEKYFKKIVFVDCSELSMLGGLISCVTAEVV